MNQKILNEALEHFEAMDYIKAKNLFLSISNKNSTAQYYLGAIYRMGLGVRDDQKEAFTWFLKAAKQGHKESQFLVGCAYIICESYHLRETDLVINDFERIQKHSDNDFSIWQDFYPYFKIEGIGVEPNDEEGVMWISRAANQGYPNAQLALGDIYDLGVGVKEDKKEARVWYTKAKDNGCIIALRRLAIYSFIYDEDFSKGIDLLKRGHELGDSRSSFNLGKRYEKNHNIKEAFKWYKISAEEFNYFESQMKLGDFYYEGKTGKVDIKQSITWYKKAIESYKTSHSSEYLGNAYEKLQKIRKLGYDDAISDYEIIDFLKDDAVYFCSSRIQLREFYKNGYDVGEKYTRLYQMLEKAEQGDKQAQIDYGYIYNNGGIRYDRVKSIEKDWYMVDAARGDKDSQYLLSKEYTGENFKAERLFWLKKAADNGHARAQFEYAIFQKYKHPLESIKYMQLAAKSVVNAQVHLGYAYAHGNVVEKNYIEAYGLYQKAASKIKNMKGMKELRHINRIKFWYNAANDEAKTLALQGDVDAQLYMGCLYQYGFEVKRNLNKSLVWYEMAKKNASDEAQIQLEILRKDIE